TTLLAMPNTQPPLVTLENWRIAQTRAQNESLCDVFLYAGASADHLDQLPALAETAPALKIYLDETYGPLRVQELGTLMCIMELWPSAKPICLHAEAKSIAVALGLAAVYGKPVHICHVSRKDEIELIAKAKAQGLPVTCEVTPHHLFLTEADAKRLGSYGYMRPTLATEEDRQALWAHINTTIDCIASDHAPHTREEKGEPGTEMLERTRAPLQSEGEVAAGFSAHVMTENIAGIDGTQRQRPQRIPPPGVPGLESTLPLMLTAAARGLISYPRLVELLSTNPRRIFHLPEQPETYIEIDPAAHYTFPERPLYTKCGWSPFTGMEMTGRIEQVVLRGTEVVRNGLLTVSSSS
ncbi:MAG: hypothetical protein ABFD05_02070, partial [Anaerolineaceae bacterium]